MPLSGTGASISIQKMSLWSFLYLEWCTSREVRVSLAADEESARGLVIRIQC